MLYNAVGKLMQEQILNLIARKVRGQTFASVEDFLRGHRRSRHRGKDDGFGLRVKVGIRASLRGQSVVFLIDFLLEDRVNSVIAVQIVADSFEGGLLHIQCLSGFREFPSPFDVYIIARFVLNVKLRVCYQGF